MSVRENAGRGKSFWGLVEQKGPWKETRNDRFNSRTRSPYGVGSGTPRMGRGGTANAGFGDFDSLTMPGCVSGRKPPPKPSVYAQRSVVYKPLVFDGPVGIAGRIGAKQAHLKGLGDRANSGSDQGVQTSGNVLGVGVPARQNLSAISQQEAIQQKLGGQLSGLQQRNKLEDVNPLVQHANKVFGNGGSVRQTGTFGSAVGMTPHPGTEVMPGESVGSVLRKATGEAGKFAGIVAPIPILGDVARAGAAGLGAAAGAVSAGEALVGGDIPGAIGHGQDAYREAIRLQNITGQVTADWNRNSGAFNTAASEYHTAEGGSMATDPSLDRKINKWLDEYEVDSLADLESELERLIETENGKSKRAIEKVLTEVKQVAVDYAPQGRNLSIVHGESVTFLPIKTGVSGGGSKEMGTGTDNIVQLTETVGTQYEGGNSALEVAQYEEIQRLIGDMEKNRAVSNGRLVDVMNILGLDSPAIFEALQRGEEDHVIDLIVEARDNLRVPMRLPPLDVTDLVNNQRRQGGLAQVGTQTVFVPPRQALVDQATDMSKDTVSHLGKRKERYIEFGVESGGGRRRRLNPINRIEARGGGLKGRGVQQVARAKKAPAGSLRNLAYKALPRRESSRNK